MVEEAFYTSWVTRDNIVGETFAVDTGLVLGLHMEDDTINPPRLAITTWWYGEFTVIAVFIAGKLVYTG